MGNSIRAMFTQRREKSAEITIKLCVRINFNDFFSNRSCEMFSKLFQRSMAPREPKSSRDYAYQHAINSFLVYLLLTSDSSLLLNAFDCFRC